MLWSFWFSLSLPPSRCSKLRNGIYAHFTKITLVCGYVSVFVWVFLSVWLKETLLQNDKKVLTFCEQRKTSWGLHRFRRFLTKKRSKRVQTPMTNYFISTLLSLYLSVVLQDFQPNMVFVRMNHIFPFTILSCELWVSIPLASASIDFDRQMAIFSSETRTAPKLLS